MQCSIVVVPPNCEVAWSTESVCSRPPPSYLVNLDTFSSADATWVPPRACCRIGLYSRWRRLRRPSRSITCMVQFPDTLVMRGCGSYTLVHPSLAGTQTR